VPDRTPHFSTELFEFLRELSDNNTREWFAANRDRYRSVVQEPMLQFIADMAEPLRAISPAFIADPRPSGGSMFRIHRDVRFSRDTRPYKTHAAAQFRHRAHRDVHAPGFYLHLEPGQVFVGAGCWHPAREALGAIRSAIVERPARWRSVGSDPLFSAHHHLSGETLKRAPRGYDSGHPLIDDLKRTDFVCLEEFTDKAACGPAFIDDVAGSFAAARPLVRFLTDALDLDF
jgi:uncharacterized protein (TIGR02453 family)